MTPSEPNHARDRLSGRSGQPFTLGAPAPGPEDWKRWLLADAARIVAAEEARVNDPPKPDP